MLLLLLAANLLAWDEAAPDGGFSRFSPRPALAPGFAVIRSGSGTPRLQLTGSGRPNVFGGWRRVVRVSAGRAYRMRATVAVRGAESPRRQVACQVRWQGEQLAEEVAPLYADDRAKEPGCDAVLVAPPKSTAAETSLLLLEAPAAVAEFAEIGFEEASLPPSRPVRVATLYWRPSTHSTPARNVEALAILVDRVALQRPDVVLLSEAITSIGTGLSVDQAAQDPRGPAFEVLSARARRHRTYIVYGAYERAGDLVYNSAFVVGRDGSLVATYRKVQIPVGEAEAGLSAGNAIAPFDLDFGRVGILICHDTAFDEPARVLTLAGAEMILAPAWGGDMTQIRARALDNGIHVVTAGYDVPSAVIDPSGEVRAQTWKGQGDGTAFATVDLARRSVRPWIGDWHAAMMKQRRPDLYGGLAEEPR